MSFLKCLIFPDSKDLLKDITRNFNLFDFGVVISRLFLAGRKEVSFSQARESVQGT